MRREVLSERDRNAQAALMGQARLLAEQLQIDASVLDVGLIRDSATRAMREREALAELLAAANASLAQPRDEPESAPSTNRKRAGTTNTR